MCNEICSGRKTGVSKKLKTLILRKAHLEERILGKIKTGDPVYYERAEAGALGWAIQVLRIHIDEWHAGMKHLQSSIVTEVVNHDKTNTSRPA